MVTDELQASVEKLKKPLTGEASSPDEASPDIHADSEAMRSILNSVPSLLGNEDLREMSALRDSFMAQVPEQSVTETVRTLWQNLWARAMVSLTPSQMQRLGKAFVFSAQAHAEQKRKSGDPYIIHTLSAALILAEMRLDLASLTAASMTSWRTRR